MRFIAAASLSLSSCLGASNAQAQGAADRPDIGGGVMVTPVRGVGASFSAVNASACASSAGRPGTRSARMR